MKRPFALLGVFGLWACAQTPVQPSPTSDQVLAAQYRARGTQGQMSGAESQKVMEAYERDIAKPAQTAGQSSNYNLGEMGSR